MSIVIYRFTCPVTGLVVDRPTSDLPTGWTVMADVEVSLAGQAIIAQRLLYAIKIGQAPTPAQLLAPKPCPLDPPPGTQITTV